MTSLPDFEHVELTKTIIGCFYGVYNELGYGFLEKVYENALTIALRQAGLTVNQQVPIAVYFNGQIVGKYEADLVVNDVVIVELKAAQTICSEHEALNFGSRSAEIKRKAYSNERKGSLSWTKPTEKAAY